MATLITNIAAFLGNVPYLECIFCIRQSVKGRMAFWHTMHGAKQFGNQCYEDQVRRLVSATHFDTHIRDKVWKRAVSGKITNGGTRIFWEPKPLMRKCVPCWSKPLFQNQPHLTSLFGTVRP